MSNNTILKALERMGYKGRMTGHGFRGLASTVLHEQGCNHDHIELQLAHAPPILLRGAHVLPTTCDADRRFQSSSWAE